jgi:alpha-tubulin suppressor-like RCC1 family protein
VRVVLAAVSVWAALACEPVGAQTLAGGLGHSAVLKPDGTVWVFGYNNNGQLGDDTTTVRREPQPVSGLSDIVAVAAGAYHTLALTSDGSVYAWGDNAYGQIGDGTTTDRKTPVQLGLNDVVAIAAGEYHSVALRSNGDAYTWGRNNNGQLGLGNTTNYNLPQQMTSGGGAVGAGLTHTLVVKTDGTTWATGANANGQLGDGTTTQRTTAVQMSGVAGALAVAGGQRHTIILLADGTVKAAGYNAQGQLGDGTTTQRTTAVTVSGLSGVSAVAAGENHTLAITSAGGLLAWGLNTYGRLGDGTTTNRNTPATIMSSIVKIGAGAMHSLAVSSAGVVFTWGRNHQSQLGEGTTEDRSVPGAISGEAYNWRVATPTVTPSSGTYSTDQTVTISVVTPDATIHYTTNDEEPTESDATIASGATLQVAESQTVKAKAFKYGMTPGETTTRVYTMKVGTPSVSPGGGTYTAPQTVSVSSVTSGAVLRYTTDGSQPTEVSTVYTAPLAIGTTTQVKIVGFREGWTTSDTRTATYTMNFGTLPDPAIAPAAGTYESGVEVTLSASYGAAIHYTLNGGTPTTNSPLYVGPIWLDATTTVRARAYHPDYSTSGVSLALFTVAVAQPAFAPSGGSYQAGQLITVTTATPGATIRYTIDGSEPTTASPVIVSGSTVAAGNYTLKATAWKTGATTSATTAATYEVTGQVTAPLVAAGGNHALGLRDDGVVWAWGQNAYGQLGNGTTGTPKLLPALVVGLTGIEAVSAGSYHSLVLRQDGGVFSFGYNHSGRLGDGTTVTRSLPVAVDGLSDAIAIAAGHDHSVALKSDGTVVAWGNNGTGEVGDGSTTNRLVPTAVLDIEDVIAIAAGRDFSAAAAADGSVWTWGSGQSGRLGHGSTSSSSTPVEVANWGDVLAVAAGDAHGLALLGDGTVRAWGLNTSGQLGDGSTTTRLTPVTVAGLSDVVAISGGSNHSLFLTADGTVWATGANSRGQLGDGTTAGRTTVATVPNLTDIIAIAAGDEFSLAVSDQGVVWAWGYNTDGQLGDGTTTNRLSPTAISGSGMAWRVATPELSHGSGLYFVALDVTVTCVDPEATIHYTLDGSDPTTSSPTVTSGGTVAILASQVLKVSAWKTGAPTSVIVSRAYELKATPPEMTPQTGAYGSPQEVALATTTPGASIRYTLDGTDPTVESPLYAGPLMVGEALTLRARAHKEGWTASASAHASYWISAGVVSDPVLTPEGGVMEAAPLVSMASTTAGATIRYTLDGTDPAPWSGVYRHPFVVRSTTTVKARAYKAGLTPSAVVSETYEVDAEGATDTPLIVPGGGWFVARRTVTVTGPSGAVLRYTTDGSDPTTADPTIASGATLDVEKSQVLKVRAWESGLGPSAVRRADFVITGAVAAGNLHTLALDGQGRLWAWGGNAFRQVGNDSSADQLTPVQVLTDVAGLAAGDRHSLAVKADGTAWGWGSADHGQVGTGQSSGTRSTPGQVQNLDEAMAVAAGNWHSLALRSDGSVWAWGRNNYGQLGDGSTQQRSTPVQVMGLTGVVAIAAGDDFSVALQADAAEGGIVWAWGRNQYGQLGDGTTVDRVTPVRVPGLAGVSAIGVGGYSAFAVTVAGEVFSWGRNHEGQLGIGSTSSTSTPTHVAPLTRVWVLAAGAEHVLAVDRTARTWGWGSNNNGRLGTNSSGAWVVPSRSDLGASLRISGGSAHTVAALPDGSVAVFGAGGSGRLGLGSTTSQSLPVSIPGFSIADNAWLVTDADQDGLPTWLEYLIGTDPLNGDTNGNGVLDGVEYYGGHDPLNPDSDGDGVPNWVEVANGTDPFRADTDGDGVPDGEDAFPLDPDRSDPLPPTQGDTTPPIITLTEPVGARPVP